MKRFALVLALSLLPSFNSPANDGPSDPVEDLYRYLDFNLKYFSREQRLPTQAEGTKICRYMFGLIKQGANPNSQSFLTGATPMHWAAQFGHLELLGYLIDHGEHGQVNALTDDGHTPLYFAEFGNQPEAKKMLIKAGANEMMTFFQNTPLMVAAIRAATDFSRREPERSVFIFGKGGFFSY